jgi:hypothetical protein
LAKNSFGNSKKIKNMKGAFLAIYEKIKASIQHAINDDAEDWSIMPSDVAKEIDGGFKAYAEGLEEQAETLRAEQSVFMQTQAQTLAEHVFDEAQHLTQAQANEIAKVEGKVDKTDFKDHLEDDERHLTFSDRLEINSIKDKASAEDLQRHISNPDVHYPIEITQEYTDVAIDKAKAELLEAIAQGGGSASVDLSGVIDRISDVEGALTAHKNDPSIHFKIEETKIYADAKLQEAKGYTDTEVAKIQGAVGGLEGVFLCEDTSDGKKISDEIIYQVCYVGNNKIVYVGVDERLYLMSIDGSMGTVCINKAKSKAPCYVENDQIVYSNKSDDFTVYIKNINDDSDGIRINNLSSYQIKYVGNRCIIYTDDTSYFENINKLYLKNIDSNNTDNGTVVNNFKTSAPCYLGKNMIAYNSGGVYVKNISSGENEKGTLLINTYSLESESNGTYMLLTQTSGMNVSGIKIVNAYNPIENVFIIKGAVRHACFVSKNQIVYCKNGLYLKNINTYI